MLRTPRGFTLVELMIVVLVIGIIAVIALPKFVNTRERTYIAAMKSDLRNLATAQEDYFATHYSYGSNLSQLDFRRSGNVLIAIPEATSRGWRATATFSAAPHLACELYYGQASGATTATREGVIACN